MRNPVVAWLKVGAIFEVLACVAVALLWVFDGLTPDEAQSWALKLTLVVAIFAVAGAVIGSLLAKPATGANLGEPKP